MLVQEERNKEICKYAATPTESLAFTSDKSKIYDQRRINEGNNGNKRTYTQNGGGKRNNNYFVTIARSNATQFNTALKSMVILTFKGRTIAANTR